MKKFITIAALILGVLFIFSATSVFAQYAYFGVKGGINLANVWGEDTDPDGALFIGWDDKKIKIGFAAGGYSTIVLTNWFALQPELLFTMQGTSYEYSEELPGYSFWVKETLKLGYIQLPVLLKFYIPMEGNVKINAFAGPYVAYNVYAKARVQVEETGFEDYDEIEDIEDDWGWGVRKFDYGAVAGAGVDFIIKGRQLTVDARYTIGFANIFQDLTGWPEDPVFRNGTISVMVGIGF